VFLGPAFLLCIRWLSPSGVGAPARRAPLPTTAARPFDLLRVPLVGPLLRAPYGRRLLQATSFALAMFVIVDGLRGPRVAAMNLAGVVPWIWWRALMVGALVAVGNLACMACPFTLPRALARRFGHATRTWPRALRSKWAAAALLAAFFVAQERLAWWDAPRATALLVIAYFVAAFTVDVFVRGAAFCKYVCPIGQFQFVGSLVSPLEVKIRLPIVCADCAGKDCVHGNSRRRGCELDLYLPLKVGNLDCTFCLDCVKACPSDNIGILAVAPGASIGRLSHRLDVAILGLVVVLAAFGVAGVMVRAEHAASVVAIALLVAAAMAAASYSLLGRASFCRLALALVPLGMGMWAAHLAFHLMTGWPSIVPIVQRVMGFGEPDWSLACAGSPSDALLGAELLLLDAGVLLSLYLGWKVAPQSSRYVPFASVALSLWAAGAWILFQPMQMRGMLM
jgi:ferredoxin